MVVHQSVAAETLTNRLIDVLSGFPGIREVWITNDRGESIFWVITDQLSNDAERALYEATNVLYDLHPSAPWDLHMLNPAYFPSEHVLRQSVPARATLVKSFRHE